MSKSRYVVRPRADRDLDEQSCYYATAAGAQVGHRILLAAYDTFALLATQPDMGWRWRLKRPELEQLRVVHGSRQLHARLRREDVE